MGCGGSKTGVAQSHDTQAGKASKRNPKEIETEEKRQDESPKEIETEEKRQDETPKEIETEVNGEQFKDYEISVLNVHNDYRSKHGGPDMTLNRDLCDMAQTYAEYLLEHDLFEHSSTSQRQLKGEYVGENLGYYMGHRFETYDSTPDWYNEIKDFDFAFPESEPKSVPIGHFTQVVWKGSIELGVGVATDPESRTFMMVGRYHPGGNIVGRFAENVLPPNSI